MSSKNSETEWIFTASWPLNSTVNLYSNQPKTIHDVVNLKLKEELESSLNLAAAMVRADQPLSELRERELTVRLYVSRTAKGCRRVISIEEHTPSSLPFGSEQAKPSGVSTPDTPWSGDPLVSVSRAW